MARPPSLSSCAPVLLCPPQAYEESRELFRRHRGLLAIGGSEWPSIRWGPHAERWALTGGNPGPALPGVWPRLPLRRLPRLQLVLRMPVAAFVCVSLCCRPLPLTPAQIRPARTGKPGGGDAARAHRAAHAAFLLCVQCVGQLNASVGNGPWALIARVGRWLSFNKATVNASRGPTFGARSHGVEHLES